MMKRAVQQFSIKFWSQSLKRRRILPAFWDDRPVLIKGKITLKLRSLDGKIIVLNSFMECYCLREDKNDQTTRAQTDELAIQTELSLQKERNGVDVEQQTDTTSSSDEGIQTLSVEMKDTESMTSAIKSIVKIILDHY